MAGGGVGDTSQSAGAGPSQHTAIILHTSVVGLVLVELVHRNPSAAAAPDASESCGGWSIGVWMAAARVLAG
jgi:hypothetical protein